MTKRPPSPLRRYSLDKRALDLITLLEGAGTRGMTRDAICAKLGWGPGQFASTIDHARNVVCPDLAVTIPHPVPDDGWCYKLTGEWLHHDGTPAIEAGTAYAVSAIETRLRAVLRDVEIAAGNLDSRSVNGRKCNFLRKHLTHLIGTLVEIGVSADQMPEEAA